VYPNFLEAGTGLIYTASAAKADEVTANHVAFMLPRSDGVNITSELGGLTFTPGTYRSVSTLNVVAGTFVTLDGLNEPNPTFLFQAEKALTTAANAKFVLINGARTENVFWALGTAATLGANSTTPGSLLTGTSVTFGTGSELLGCALAQVTVTFASGGFVTSGKRVPN
jgi:hypothetical protein